MRKAGIYEVRRMPGKTQRINFQVAGKDPAKYDTEVKGSKCFIPPTC